MANIQNLIMPMVAMLQDTVDLKKGDDPSGPNPIMSVVNSRELSRARGRRVKKKGD